MRDGNKKKQIEKNHFKFDKIMKLLKGIYIGIVACLFTSCYDDYKEDYDTSVAYFYNQELTRSFVVNEVHEIKVGITMGGKRFSEANETVEYTIDPSLLTETGLTLLPPEYYTLNNPSQFEVHKGDFDGNITLTIKPAFFNESMALAGTYALPFRLTDTSLDALLEDRDILVLQLKYEASMFGNYYHNGATVAKDAQGVIIDELSSVYHQEEPVTNDVNNWILSTLSSNTLATSGISNLLDSETNRRLFDIAIDNDGAVTVASNPESTIDVSQNGTCSYDTSIKEFYINYSYTLEGNNYFATDTLSYRNRILDGVNQWNN
tara:strand:+ start:5414 stop:6373 length:960 start_codon:yes stop_codon:yes gene_type:complete